MKAALFTGNRSFVIEEVDYPQVEPDGVVIKVKASGICGSDLHLYRHAQDVRMVFGHEFSGDVVDIGTDVTGIKKGDRVTVMSGRGCGECSFCRQGDIVHCSQLQMLGYAVQGAMAEYVSVPFFNFGVYSAKIPDNLSYEMAATAEPLSVALYAVNQMQPRPGDTVVVIGLGIIGLCIIQILKSRGVTDIIASGRRTNRLILARKSGARVVVDAAQADIVSSVKKETSNKGADIVFEVAGTPEAFKQSLEIVHRGGKVDIVGLYEKPVTWNPGFIAMNDLVLAGCGLKFDIPGAVELMQSGKVDTRPYITHRFPLDKIKEAYDTQLENREAIKVLLKP
jgi:2-desacetyl-2-hydroxyethyl bacteriochlorophyllide A dehydrogenase